MVWNIWDQYVYLPREYLLIVSDLIFAFLLINSWIFSKFRHFAFYYVQLYLVWMKYSDRILGQLFCV